MKKNTKATLWALMLYATLGAPMCGAEVAALKQSWECGFAVVPPVPITTQGRADWRLALRNESDSPVTVDVEVSLTDSGGHSETLFTQPVEVEPHGQKSLGKAIPVAQHVGANTVRYVVSGPDNSRASGEEKLVVVKSDLAAVPLCQAAWMEPGALAADGYEHSRPIEEADLRKAIDRLDEIGMRCLIIVYAESVCTTSGAYYPSKVFADKPRDPTFDVIGATLDQAEKNGQKVIIGLGRGPDLYLTWDAWEDPQRLAAGIDISNRTADELWQLYGKSPALYGWYLSHEANDIARASKHYYNPVVAHLREFAAEKPVLISPSGTPIISPEILEECDADIISYQDAVGPGYIPYEYTWDPERRLATLPEVYAQYADIHRDARQHLWSTLEFWEMSGPDYGGAYPASFDRVRRQIDIERSHVGVLTAYAALGFIEHPDSAVALGGDRAKRLYEAYKEYYCRTAQEIGLINTPGEENVCKMSP